MTFPKIIAELGLAFVLGKIKKWHSEVGKYSGVHRDGIKVLFVGISDSMGDDSS